MAAVELMAAVNVLRSHAAPTRQARTTAVAAAMGLLLLSATGITATAADAVRGGLSTWSVLAPPEEVGACHVTCQWPTRSAGGGLPSVMAVVGTTHVRLPALRAPVAGDWWRTVGVAGLVLLAVAHHILSGATAREPRRLVTFGPEEREDEPPSGTGTQQ